MFKMVSNHPENLQFSIYDIQSLDAYLHAEFGQLTAKKDY